MRPTLYLTSTLHARARVHGTAGPGNVWSIMARPDVRAGDAGHGRCWPLVPVPQQTVRDERAAVNVARVAAQVNFDDQRSAVAREHDVPELDVTAALIHSGEDPGLVRFRDHYFDGAALWPDGSGHASSRTEHVVAALRPGLLLAQANGGRGIYEVKNGDTLICSCSTERAREGRCHRAWAAILLCASGWSVVLDGRLLDLAATPESLRGLWPRRS